MTDTLPEVRLAQKLRYIAMILTTVDPSGPMTETIRLAFAGEVAGHHQAVVTALLDLMPTVPFASIRSEYAQTLHTIAVQTEGGTR